MTDRSFHIMTFGCQMNVTDSDWIRRSLTSRGWTEAPFGQAGVYLLNTCSVREKAEHKVYSEIGRIRQVTGDTPEVMVAVGGCVAQQVGKKLFSRFAQVRLVFGSDGLPSVPDAIERLVSRSAHKVSLLDFSDHYEERDPCLSGDAPPSAFVSIMQGCDNYCAYCIVPYVRGRQRSRSVAAVAEECEALVRSGTREITLLGQNVNAFGQDQPGSPGFAALLHRVAAIQGLERLRFVTPHPKDLDDEVIAAFGQLPILAPRLHLPLQSGSDRILKLMGRRYDTARFRKLVQGLRAARPDIHLSTDVIVGFPGETEEDFLATLDFMREIGFVGSFSFAYSDRPGTRASLMADKLDKEAKLARLAKLQKWQYDFAWKTLEGMVGNTVTVLLENEAASTDGETRWHGREEHGHSVTVTVTGTPPARGWVGSMVPVRISGAGMHALRGDQCGEAW